MLGASASGTLCVLSSLFQGNASKELLSSREHSDSLTRAGGKRWDFSAWKADIHIRWETMASVERAVVNVALRYQTTVGRGLLLKLEQVS